MEAATSRDLRLGPILAQWPVALLFECSEGGPVDWFAQARGAERLGPDIEPCRDLSETPCACVLSEDAAQQRRLEAKMGTQDTP